MKSVFELQVRTTLKQIIEACTKTRIAIMKDIQRPLFKHIRNHDVLFSEIALTRNDFIMSLGLDEHHFHKTPKLITAEGKRLSIEPERSIVLNNYTNATGVKALLGKQLPGFNIIPGSDIGFRYPTAALASNDSQYIKRFRSEYFHRVDETRDICRPINLSYGIKSRGKSDNREEYEVWLPEDNLRFDPGPLFIEKYAEDLPAQVLSLATEDPIVHGWMGVKRCAFEGTFQHSSIGDIVVCLALSLDAYNIGARPDLSYSTITNSSIAYGGAEFEWEVLGYYCHKDSKPSHDDIWHAINTAITAISQPLENAFNVNIVPSNESKTERILSAIAAMGISAEEIQELNLKPWEFLQTHSKYRRKPQNNTRTVNFLGRLNRLFYNPELPLPSLRELHYLAAKPIQVNS
jgi:hypothetical protein